MLSNSCFTKKESLLGALHTSRNASDAICCLVAFGADAQRERLASEIQCPVNELTDANGVIITLLEKQLICVPRFDARIVFKENI